MQLLILVTPEGVIRTIDRPCKASFIWPFILFVQVLQDLKRLMPVSRRTVFIADRSLPSHSIYSPSSRGTPIHPTLAIKPAPGHTSKTVYLG